MITNGMKSTKNPVYEKTYCWPTYDVAKRAGGQQKRGKLELWQHNRFRSNKRVGRGTFKIPSETDQSSKLVVELKSDKGKVIGCAVLQALLQTLPLTQMAVI